MTLQEIIDELHLKVLTQNKDFSTVLPSGGYAADLLSCVMAGAKHKNLWVTLQAHVNIVAVAALLDLSAVIITEDAQPDLAVITKANQEGLTLLSTGQTTYAIAGQLWEMGLRNEQGQ
ncbi:MAG: DRTGG domain-containing protein [Anaerolineaceae bacterium]|nr:DRTGG domain-containing protein [Anaerolineaceae bacterium]